jgi:hypothetical protein
MMKRVFGIIGGVSVASMTGYCVSVSMRPASEKLHIVMDLDNTILQSFPVKAFANINHSNVRKHDHVLRSNVRKHEHDLNDKDYFVWHRPFAHVSLWFLNKLFIVHVFTAATQEYAEACLQSFPGLFENKRFYRESVTKKDSHGKDLRLIEESVSADNKKDLRLMEDGRMGLFENTRLYPESPLKDLRLVEDGKIILVDDQARNRTGDQAFYHIPPYSRFYSFDFELPKFCAWAVYWQFVHDFKK